MSSQLPEIPTFDPSTLPQLGVDAPLLPTRGLIGSTKFNPNQATYTSLGDQALGRASQVLDAVRNRKVTWQQARDLLKTLSADDKKTIAKFRPEMGEDEKRALDLPKGGGLLGRIEHGVGHVLGQGLLETLGVGSGGDKELGAPGRIVGNLVSDTGATVRALPAGLVKAGVSVAQDVGTLATNPAEELRHPLSHTREGIVDPMIDQYGYTYGPAFHGDFGKTAGRIAEHPLGPVLDAFAVASAGIGTAARTAAVSRAIAAQKITREAGGISRVGVVDRTTETYEPLGYNKEFYVRPSRKEMATNPITRGMFSALINAKTGKAIFSPVGGTHDEIYNPLFEGKGSATRDQWDNPEKNPVIQATGVFDPKTGKVGSININPEDVPSPYLENVPKFIEDVRKQAEDTYLSRDELKGIQRTNSAGSLVIRQGKAQKRYDPATGEKLDATWYVSQPNGKRIASNFPTEDSAIAHAQSLVTGGVLPDVLEQSWREFYEPAYAQRPIERSLKTPVNEKEIPLTDESIANVLRETSDWPRIEKFTSGELDASHFAHDTMEMAQEFGDQVFEYRTPDGKLGGIASYTAHDSVPLGGEPFVKLDGVAAAPGNAIRIIAAVARKYPGYRLDFNAATERLSHYYENIGATYLHGGTGGVMSISAEDAAKLAAGKPIVAGAINRERLLGEGTKPKSALRVGLEAFRQRPRGSLIDKYEAARGISHSKEYETIINEVIGNVLDDPETAVRGPKREALKNAIRDVAESMATTASKDLGKFRSAPLTQPEFISPASSAALRAAGISIREISDLVRAGAVFLRPAYIPNNWAGNAFLNTIQQGVFAPINLAKSLWMDKHLGTQYTRAVDQSMGFNATNVMTGGRGAGYVASATDPVAKIMGSIADQPFRRAAWLHEARRLGYKKMSDVRRLWDQANKEKGKFDNRDPAEWDMSQTPALAEIGKISRNAQEEIIKFGKYNDIESSVLRNLIFVYSWMRGAGRYFGRFPMVHPIQAAAMTSLAGVGQNWLNQELGGVPAFLVGAIPVGKDEKGNHILINPFSINPLSTGQEMLATAASMKNIITDPTNFNKYVNQDPSALLNPLVQDALEAWSGGRPMTESVPDSIAALRLKQNLEHPGRGQIYPTSQKEALGQFFLGSMFPRKSSQAGITRSLQRERADQPELRIDDEVASFEKQTGAKVPPQFIEMYRSDLKKLADQKDFQHSYAKKHGSQGFSNMPPENRAEAAVQYLARTQLVGPAQLRGMEKMITDAKSDYAMNILANALWRMTGAGRVKDQWDNLLHTQSAVATDTGLRP